VKVDQTDALYLISAVNHMFPDIVLGLEDVQSSWAGLRPLIHEEGKSAGELSRKDEIFESENGLISIAGGKLTGYRKMAERITDLVCKKLKKEYDTEFLPVQTKEIKVQGGDFEHYKAVKNYRKKVFTQIAPFGFSELDAEILVGKYGKQCEIILQKMDTLKDGAMVVRLTKAELWFCLHYEMVLKPLDFFERRTANLYFDIEQVEKLKQIILDEFAIFFHWDTQTLTLETQQLNAAIRQVRTFY
jgi:glycerol-3-phosphate dehydrogenase